jgi:hypothetical protein
MMLFLAFPVLSAENIVVVFDERSKKSAVDKELCRN